jgi:hypothetical protein
MSIVSLTSRIGSSFARAPLVFACIVAHVAAQGAPVRGVLVAPTNITLSGAAGAVTVGWTAVAGAARYSVLRSETATAKATELGSPVTTTAFLDKTATAGTTYYYRVAAVRADGHRDTSTAVAYTVPKPRTTDTLPARSPSLTRNIGIDSRDLGAPHTRRPTILLERELP